MSKLFFGDKKIKEVFVGDKATSAVYKGDKKLWEKGQGFTLEVTVGAGDSITLNTIDKGTFDYTVDWGDKSSNHITSYDSADRTHNYTNPGVYNIEIKGECPSMHTFGDDSSKITDIIYWGDESVFGGFSDIASSVSNGLFYNCLNLKSTGQGKILTKEDLTSLHDLFRNCNNENFTEITPGLFDNCTQVSSNGFRGTFQRCENLQSIPAGLFDNNTQVSSSGFFGTFSNCSNLQSIPEGLFDNNTQVSSSGFLITFQGCENLQSIPEGLFDNNTQVSTYGFLRTFQGCENLQSIPEGLFDNNTQVSTYGFIGTFQRCENLQSIPAGLFDNNTQVSTYGFFRTFQGCENLQSIPEGLFDNNTQVSTYGFLITFQGCKNLQSIPEGLFKYNKNCTCWEGCFDGCTKLQLNPNIFYESDPESGDITKDNRFKDQTINFKECFNLTNTFEGIIGTAPDLWNCDFGTGTPTKTNCFDGHSNSSLTNWEDVPEDWGGDPEE